GGPSRESTHYQVFIGPGTAFERDGLTRDDFPDGPENTLLIVEAADPVPWTKPVDLVYDPNGPVPELGTRFAVTTEVCNYTIRSRPASLACFADGTFHFLDARTSERKLRALITRNGGERIDPNRLD